MTRRGFGLAFGALLLVGLAGCGKKGALERPGGAPEEAPEGEEAEPEEDSYPRPGTSSY